MKKQSLKLIIIPTPFLIFYLTRVTLISLLRNIPQILIAQLTTTTSLPRTLKLTLDSMLLLSIKSNNTHSKLEILHKSDRNL
jgi:hypothetical protein